MERESDVRINQNNTFKGRDNVVKLGSVRLQELASCGYIVEEIFDHEVRTRRTGTGFLRYEARACDDKMRP